MSANLKFAISALSLSAKVIVILLMMRGTEIPFLYQNF